MSFDDGLGVGFAIASLYATTPSPKFVRRLEGATLWQGYTLYNSMIPPSNSMA